MNISSNIRFVIIPFIIMAALLISSFLFNSQINKLKEQIDNIYFGNFIPVHKLHIIKENFENIIKSKSGFDKKSFERNILEEWEYYFNAYKSNEERRVVNAVNEDIHKTFENASVAEYKNMIKSIDFLIDYEVGEASKQRKEFLRKYENMRDYLFYNSVAIVIFALIFTAIVIYEMLKKQSKLEKLNRKYKIDSKTDGLTKLYNRKYFDQIFDNMTEILKESEWHGAFVLLDIDFFKQYNDTYGHDKGDEALKSVAGTLKNYFNKEFEYVFRVGGEEFAIIMFDIDEKILINALDGFMQEIANLKIEHKASKAGEILSVSMGVVVIDENSYDMTPRELYVKADKNLYGSKENGRNRYTL